jgi:Predicted glutamine amidotransferase
MCLVIHKPRDIELPDALLDSAADYNPHGYGLMAFADDGDLQIIRSAETRKSELLAQYREFRDHECVIHLRYGTSGAIDGPNTHPIEITPQLYVAHNGTVNLERHVPERSDTWHLVNDYLRPILSRRPELLYDRFFQELMTTWCGPHNKFVFMDGAQKRTVIVNRQSGFEVEGLWLSNTRWFDASRFSWRQASATPEPVGPRLQFSI